jgi:small subunit ribosomal protein S19
MPRSLIKGPFVSYYILQKIAKQSREDETPIKTQSRSSTIVPIIVGFNFSIYNGQDYYPIFITDQIVGHKFGEFVPTRTFRGHIKSSKGAKRKRLSYYV